jgi:hypothetical protein
MPPPVYRPGIYHGAALWKPVLRLRRRYFSSYLRDRRRGRGLIDSVVIAGHDRRRQLRRSRSTVMAGLDPAIQGKTQAVLYVGWTAGSSPAVTT